MQWQVRSLFLTSASDEFVWGDRNYSLTCRYLYGHLSRLSIFSRYSWYRLKPQSIRAWFSSTVVFDDHMSPTLTCYHWPSPWPYLLPLPQLWPEVKEHSLHSKFYFRNLEMSLYKRRSQFVVWRHLIQRRWWTDNISGIDSAAIFQSQALKADLNAIISHKNESSTHEYHYQAVLKTRSDRVMIKIYGNDKTKTKVQCITRLNGFKTTLSLIFRTTSLISLTAISLLRAPSVEKLDHPNPSSRLTFDSIRLCSGTVLGSYLIIYGYLCIYKIRSFFSY